MNEVFSVPKAARVLFWKSPAGLRRMCMNGEIHGASRLGRVWAIPESWVKAEEEKEKVQLERFRDVLIGVGKRGETLTYSEAALPLGLDMSLSNGRRLIGQVLDRISADEYEKSRILLSALVVHKHDGLPGVGFFKMAQKEWTGGKEVSLHDRPDLYLKILKELYDFFREHPEYS